MNASDITPSIFDQSALANIKRQARSNDPAALKAAAQQFEAMFLQIVLKSMRDATPREGLFDNDQTRLYESLLDQQMSQVLAAKGGTGLAKIIESQLSQYAAEASAKAEPVSGAGGFVEKMMPHAAEASRATGIPARYIVGQAALETGWGRAEPRGVDGQPSYNLFGIKAGGNWNGPTVEATTTEYVDGIAQKRTERFRAYGSHAESFMDYAKLLTGNPRYAEAIGSSDAVGFARGLARGGYATDPAYADKLTRIINTLPS